MSLLGHIERHGEAYLIRASMHVTAQDECKHGTLGGIRTA